MRVLVACEESGTVRQAFEDMGHDAWSCDMKPSRYGGKHIRGNVMNVILDGWDLMIAHPPCTYLSKVQAIHYDRIKWPIKTRLREGKRDKAILFFQQIQTSPIERICIENPIPMRYVTDRVGEYNQIINPWMFGDPFSKATCLWLKNLPELQPTKIVDKGEMIRTTNGTNAKWYHYLSPGQDRATIRSKTFPGIARAMAEQWG
jgi:hypothetical protein